MVSAIENKCRKGYCCQSWGSCNCLRMLEGGRKRIITCAARPSQSSNTTDSLDITLELFKLAVNPPWDPLIPGMAAI